MAPSASEERFEGVGVSRFSSARGSRPTTPARRRRDRARLQLAQRLLRRGSPSSSSRRGLAVYALDLRGRGQSDGERFYVEKFADYVSDVATVVTLAKSREPGLPVFLLGHSAGGVVSCIYALDHQAELAGLICESFAFQVPAPDFALAVAQGPEPRRAARARAQAEERGLLARSRGRRRR